MNVKKEKVNILPDKSIYPKLGQAGYSIAEALAELIDNSIDARDEKVEINVKIDRKRGIITIRDNGIGMNKETAIKSIVLAHSKKREGELGQFGLGLKTACMSLGQKFIVETTPKDSGEAYIIPFDEEDFQKMGDWNNFEIGIKEDVEEKESGTKITIDKLRIRISKNSIQNIQNRLSERFSPFIQNKEVIIKINGQILKAETLKIISNSQKNFTIKLSNNNIIKGWTGILEVGSVERSGFNLYRFNRLIKAHEKLGYIYHPSKMWIFGEIHLDPIPVTHNKREFIIENPLYIEFFEKFQRHLKPILAEAQKRHRQEAIKDLPKEVKETFKDNLLKAINEVDEFKELAFPESKKPLKRSNEGDLLAEKEKRAPSNELVTEIKETRTSIKKHGRSPQKTHMTKVRFITIARKKYKFDWEWRELEEDIPKTSYLDKDNNIIKVILNSKYKILNITKPDLFYIAVYVIEGIVEVFLKENKQPFDRLITLRDKTVIKLADTISEDIDEKSIQRDTSIMQAQSYLLKDKELEQGKINKNERKVLEMRLEKGFSCKNISKTLGITRARIYQLLNSAIAKIKEIKLDSTITIPDDLIDKTNIVGDKNNDVNAIIYNFSKNYEVSIDDLLSPKRKAGLVFPRHLIMYFLRKKLNLSFPQIAKIMKKNDHTTIMHAYNKIDRLIKEDKIKIL